MSRIVKQALLGVSLAAALSLASGCSYFFQPQKVNAHKAQHGKAHNIVEADKFMQVLALAQLSLAANPSEDVSPLLSNLKDYASQKRPKTKQMTLAVIDYKLKSGSSVKHIAAPVTAAKSDYPLLQSIMEKLDGAPAIIQNIYLVSSKVAPDKNFTIPVDQDQLMLALDRQQQHILNPAQALTPSDDIAMQLSLMDFFTRQHFQDAAYLLLENVKHKLAAATQEKTLGAAMLANFSARLEAQETTLKTQMPYRF